MTCVRPVGWSLLALVFSLFVVSPKFTCLCVCVRKVAHIAGKLEQLSKSQSGLNGGEEEEEQENTSA